MNKLFNHILVPVNLNRDAPVLIEKAIGIANEFRCDVHLLYNYSPALTSLFRYSEKDESHYSNTGAAEKMNKLAEKYKDRLNNGLYIDSTLARGDWFHLIKQFIITRHIDLVVIPQPARSSLSGWMHPINVNRLARETDCPVLTITPATDFCHLKNIVIPIHDFLPIRKLATATYIARQFNAIIHLMGYKKDYYEREDDTKWVSRAYELLKDNTRLKIHSSIFDYGNSVADNTLSYARRVKADLIVVNPGKESLASGWINHLFRRNPYKKSGIPVLTVAPRPEYSWTVNTINN